MNSLYLFGYLIVCVIIFLCTIAMSTSITTTAQKTAIGVLSCVPGINIVMLLAVTMVTLVS